VPMPLVAPLRCGELDPAAATAVTASTTLFPVSENHRSELVAVSGTNTRPWGPLRATAVAGGPL
jgi:hypothetical protein